MARVAMDTRIECVCIWLDEVAVVVSLGTNPELMAFVSVKRGSGQTELSLTEALTQYCSKSLPSYMVPKKFFFKEDLPKNPNGKIDRTRLAGLAL